MTDLKTYPEGTPFIGRIGRTASSSEPAWPVARRARPGAPNVRGPAARRRRLRQLGCFGSDIRTPTFDRLAAGGLRYRDFHTTAICSPTRACLLTGRNHHSNGVGIIQEMATGFPGYNGRVPRENGFLSEMLLARGLRDAGHRQVAPDAGERIRLRRVEGAVAALARLRAVLRLPGRQDQPVGAHAGARQPLHRSARPGPTRATT